MYECVCVSVSVRIRGLYVQIVNMYVCTREV